MAATATSTSSETWVQGVPLYKTPAPVNVPGAWFDQAAVDKVIRQLRALSHTKGRWAGTPFDPEPWQVDHIIAPIFGWKDQDGLRIVRTAWIEVPRKNGKSTLMSGLATVLLVGDGEAGAEVYSAAGDKAQARIVFEAAKQMMRGNPRLAANMRMLKDVIYVPKTASAYRVLSRVAEAAHGLNVSGALVDEVHVHKSRDLIDALETGTGSREQPLIIFITTADEGQQTSVYAEKHDYTIGLAEGRVLDPTFYGAIWAAEDGDDPFDPRTWAKANPGLGTSVRPDYIAKEARRAQQSPAYLPTFLRLSLNRRVRMTARYVNIGDWDKCADTGLGLDQLTGRPCYAGLDLASTTDIAALALVFPGEDGSYSFFHRFWCPQENILERSRRDGVPYQQWVEGGWLTATPGNVIDYEAILRELKAVNNATRLMEVGYDRWGATQISQQLTAEGIKVVPIGQGFASMSAPTKDLLRLVLEGRVKHRGDPVLRWMVGNTVVRTDPAENMKPDKEKSTGRIDGVVAAIMALDRAIRGTKQSVYEKKDGDEWKL
jgi:phage terminase large subunit-like protein